ncbi:hypothetical protein GCM10023203_23360 [Actinomycetospora straminea]|uniref:Histidine kinase-like protein n=1 Tax=Actinomycetospora straminea TaxID=663607 RepID=A0ABP9ECS5_9PSEU
MDFLRESGLDAHVDVAASSVRIEPRRPNGPAAILEVDEVRYRRCLEHLAAGSDSSARPLDHARGLAMLEILELLTTDHGDGVNRVRRLWLADQGHGLHLVEERDDDPGPPPETSAGPHDEPAVFADELDWRRLPRHAEHGAATPGTELL